MQIICLKSLSNDANNLKAQPRANFYHSESSPLKKVITTTKYSASKQSFEADQLDSLTNPELTPRSNDSQPFQLPLIRSSTSYHHHQVYDIEVTSYENEELIKSSPGQTHLDSPFILSNKQISHQSQPPEQVTNTIKHLRSKQP